MNKKDKREKYIKEEPYKSIEHKQNDYKDYTETINESTYYKICVKGANAKYGGKGGKQCAEHFFKKGSKIKFYVGGQESGGKGGICKRGNNMGYGHNGGGSSRAEFGKELLIVAGGGGGNSETGKKGGDYEKNGEGLWGGGGATENTPG